MNIINKIKNINIKISKKSAMYFFIILFTAISIIIRLSYIDFKSEDYILFLKKWFDYFKNNSGMYGLNKNVGNYNVPYQILLAMLSYLPFNPLYMIKIVSIIFDYVLGISAVLIVKQVINKKDSIIPNIVYCFIIMLPTVILNSSMWGQCDSIYTSFILLSIYYMLKNKSINSFILLGVAFAFKLQTVFILPLFALWYLKDKKFHIYELLIIPLVNFIMCLPAVFLGKPLIDCFSIYFNQTKQSAKILTYNIPNLYSFISDYDIHNIVYIGILLTIVILTFFIIYIVIKKIKLKDSDYIEIGVLFLMIIVFFLPCMHDRYLYIADVLSVIYFAIKRKNIFVPIVINCVSLYSYMNFLYYTSKIDSKIVALIYLIAIIFCVEKLFDTTFNTKKIKSIEEVKI